MQLHCIFTYLHSMRVAMHAFSHYIMSCSFDAWYTPAGFQRRKWAGQTLRAKTCLNIQSPIASPMKEVVGECTCSVRTGSKYENKVMSHGYWVVPLFCWCFSCSTLTLVLIWGVSWSVASETRSWGCLNLLPWHRPCIMLSLFFLHVEQKFNEINLAAFSEFWKKKILLVSFEWLNWVKRRSTLHLIATSNATQIW